MVWWLYLVWRLDLECIPMAKKMFALYFVSKLAATKDWNDMPF